VARDDAPASAPAAPPNAVLRWALRFRSLAIAEGRWRRRGIAFAAGALSVLAMAPFFFWPVLFLTLPVLVWLIDVAAQGGVPRHRSMLRAAGTGWWFGFGYFLLGMFWIGEAFLVEAETFAWAPPFAVTLLPAGLALFYALGTAAASVCWTTTQGRVLILAVALSSAEWLRGHVLTGLPWNTLGYALTYPLVMMQSAAIFGIYALTLIAVAVFAAPLVLANDAKSRAPVLTAGRGLIASVVILLALAGYGAIVLSRGPAPMVDGVHLRIVQPSVPQREKWQPENQRAIFDLHLDLSRQNAAGRVDDLAGVTHLVWPEAAMPFMPLEQPVALEAIAALLPPGKFLLSGAIRREGPPPPDAPELRRRAFNSLMVFDHEANLAALYDKIHLVPFGEYLPAQHLLEALGFQQLTRMRGGFSIGTEPRPLISVSGLPPIGALICYEAVFPAAVVQGAARPGLLVNLTNDGWFGHSTGPYQHFHQSRLRAVEQGLPLLRAANNGISALIDAEGRIIAELGLDVRGVIDTDLPAARRPTLYARFGDIIFLLIIAISTLIIVMLSNRSSV